MIYTAKREPFKNFYLIQFLNKRGGTLIENRVLFLKDFCLLGFDVLVNIVKEMVVLFGEVNHDATLKGDMCLCLYKITPDSLTNQGLPGINIAKVCCFFETHKYFDDYFISIPIKLTKISQIHISLPQTRFT